jgi:hypothetical protein
MLFACHASSQIRFATPESRSVIPDTSSRSSLESTTSEPHGASATGIR